MERSFQTNWLFLRIPKFSINISHGPEDRWLHSLERKCVIKNKKIGSNSWRTKWIHKRNWNKSIPKTISFKTQFFQTLFSLLYRNKMQFKLLNKRLLWNRFHPVSQNLHRIIVEISIDPKDSKWNQYWVHACHKKEYSCWHYWTFR